jgi:hypothetical protein
MSNPEAGPAAYFLLGGEAIRRTQTGPAWSASFLHAAVLHSAPNVCTLGVVMLAGIPVRDADVLELSRLLREAGFADAAEWLEAAYDREAHRRPDDRGARGDHSGAR